MLVLTVPRALQPAHQHIELAPSSSCALPTTHLTVASSAVLVEGVRERWARHPERGEGGSSAHLHVHPKIHPPFLIK
jgi:hypothetical protein